MDSRNLLVEIEELDDNNIDVNIINAETGEKDIIENEFDRLLFVYNDIDDFFNSHIKYHSYSRRVNFRASLTTRFELLNEMLFNDNDNYYKLLRVVLKSYITDQVVEKEIIKCIKKYIKRSQLYLEEEYKMIGYILISLNNLIPNAINAMIDNHVQYPGDMRFAHFAEEKFLEYQKTIDDLDVKTKILLDGKYIREKELFRI